MTCFLINGMRHCCTDFIASLDPAVIAGCIQAVMPSCSASVIASATVTAHELTSVVQLLKKFSVSSSVACASSLTSSTSNIPTIPALIALVCVKSSLLKSLTSLACKPRMASFFCPCDKYADFDAGLSLNFATAIDTIARTIAHFGSSSSPVRSISVFCAKACKDCSSSAAIVLYQPLTNAEHAQ